jgi:small subunit ribosomal protein S24e
LDFKVKEDTYNPLLKRKEVSIEVDHESEGTPSRLDVRKAVASKYSTKPENVYVIDVRTKTGTQNAVCLVEVYDDPEAAQQTVPKHIQTRNLPPDERKKVREQESKKEEAKTKTEKPTEAKPEKPAPERKEAKPKTETKPPTEAPKKAKEDDAK